jgi:hypothetical protein
MNKKVFEKPYNINQSDRSLYSMLADVFVGYFWDVGMVSKEALVPRTFASEPNGGILTQSWLVLIKAFQDSSDLKTLRSNAEILDNSEEITEVIAGRSLLWGISNHTSTRSRIKTKPPILDDELLNILLK